MASQLNFEVIKIILLGSLLLAFAYSFNDYCEKRRKSKYFVAPILLLIIILPLFNYLQILFSILGLSIATAYSIKPISLREKPILVSFANAVAVPILFLIGYFYIPIINLTSLGIAFLLFCFVMVGQLLHEVTHMRQDEKKKIVTSALLFGEKNIKYICYTFLLLSSVFTYFLFYVRIINIVFLLSTLTFCSVSVLEIKIKKIDYNLRKTYVSLSAVLGLIYILSFHI